MNKHITIAHLATCLALAATLILPASCRHGGESGEGREDADSLATWVKLAPEELVMRPVGEFSRDWMALAMGNAKSFNSMTISWGSVGQLWNKPVVTVYVSSDRYSKKLMDNSNWFTISRFPDKREYKDGLIYLGSHSQKDDPDKTANSGLRVDFTEQGNPRFKDAELVIECKKIYSDEFKKDKLPQDIRDGIYSSTGLHTMYIGEIVNVYEKHWLQEQVQSDSLSRKRSRK